MRVDKAPVRAVTKVSVAIVTQAVCERKALVMVARAGSGSASTSHAGDPDVPAEAPSTEQPASAAALRWLRVVRSIQRIRRLQRIWGHLGGFLQTFPSELRDRLRDVFLAETRRR